MTLINTMSNETLDVAGVQAKFGVPPDRIVDYLTLVGDTVDNVPGVDKVGPKTAAKWIAEHGSLDGVIAAAAGIKGAVGENLRKALDWLPMGRGWSPSSPTATCRRMSPAGRRSTRWRCAPSRRARRCSTSTSRYGFRSLLRELEARSAAMRRCPRRRRAGGPAGGPAAATVPRRRAAARRATTRRSPPGSGSTPGWRELRAAPLVALDTETDSLDADAGAHRRHLASRSSPARRPTCRWRTTTPARPTSCRWTRCWRGSSPGSRTPARGQGRPARQVRHHVLANHGIAVRGYRHDTLLQSYVLEAHRPTALDKLAERHLGARA